MEEACQLILDMQKSGEVQLCVLDSIAAMSPNKEQETAEQDIYNQIFNQDKQQIINDIKKELNSLSESIKKYGVISALKHYKDNYIK